MPKRVLLFVFISLICFPALAQQRASSAVRAGYTSAYYLSFARQQEEDLTRHLGRFVPNAPARGNNTAKSILAEVNQTGQVDGCRFASVVADTAYIKTLDSDTVAELAWSGIYGDFSGDNSACAAALRHEVLERLSAAPYDETSSDFPVYSFYALVAIGLGYNWDMHPMVQDWAFEQVDKAARRHSNGREGMWAALVLNNMAPELEVADRGEAYFMSRRERFEFERKLEQAIYSYDWLQRQDADYFSPHIKGNYKDNQSVLLQLFSQANSWFASRDDDSLLKSMVTTGGLNGLGRGENVRRFSDEAESFYLHHPTPGTDGRGHWADSDNGRKHQILALLIQAISVSYASHDAYYDDGAELMKEFVERALETHPAGFKHYLYIALHGMRNGKALFDTASLYGWEREEKALQTELYDKIKKHYRAFAVMADLQGGFEVAAEWEIIGKLLGGVLKGIGAGGKAVGNAIIGRMSARGLMNLAVVEMAGRQAIKVSKAGMKSFMKKAGWKAVAIGGVVITSDAPSGNRRRTNALAY